MKTCETCALIKRQVNEEEVSFGYRDYNVGGEYEEIIPNFCPECGKQHGIEMSSDEVIENNS